MNFSEIPFRPARKTLRLFAALSLVFFLAIGLYQYMEKAHHTLGIIFGALALVIGPLGLIKPAAVRWIFVSWMVLAFPIEDAIGGQRYKLMMRGFAHKPESARGAVILDIAGGLVTREFPYGQSFEESFELETMSGTSLRSLA